MDAHRFAGTHLDMGLQQGKAFASALHEVLSSFKSLEALRAMKPALKPASIFLWLASSDCSTRSNLRCFRKDVKRRKISRLSENLKYLERIRERPVDDFLKNYESILATRHAILVSIQVCLDLAFHICAWNKLPAYSVGVLHHRINNKKCSEWTLETGVRLGAR
jgi:hypothetical protein